MNANNSVAQFDDAAVREAMESAPVTVIEDKKVEKQVQEVIVAIEQIDVEGKLSLKQIAEKLNEVIARVNSMQSGNSVTRDRGPKSEKEMTEDDARRILLGDLEHVSHKECAVKLGLSYGQVYSARKGFTFKAIYKEAMSRKK